MGGQEVVEGGPKGLYAAQAEKGRAAGRRHFSVWWDQWAHFDGIQRERERRWSAQGRAKVVHPSYGSVVVPHYSNYAAVINAAEYWGCDFTEIIRAEVWLAGPEDGPAVAMPKRFEEKEMNYETV